MPGPPFGHPPGVFPPFTSTPPAIRPYWTEVLADSPSILLKMQEASGTLVDTQVGNDATVSGAAMTYQVAGPHPGGIPYGVLFANTTLATIANSADVKFGDGPVTIEFWLKQTTAGAGGYNPVLMGDQTTAPGYIVSLASTNRLAWQTGSGSNIVWTPTGLVDAGWHHWVITRGLTVDDGLIWYDVQQVGAPQATVTFSDSGLSLILGNNFVGAMAGFAMYKSVLPVERIAAHYNARSVPLSPVQSQNLSLTAADSTTWGDAATRAFVGFRTTTDSVTNADAATRLLALLRSTTDAVTRSDVATTVRAFVRSATDSTTWSDAATRAVVLARTATDSVTRADAATRLVALFRTATDSVTWSDVATQTKVILRSATDSVTYSDAATRAVTLLRTATDSTTYADAATRIGAFLRTTADSVTRSDAATRLLVLFRTITDSTTWSDVATAVKTGANNYFMTATESITFADVATRSGTFLRTATDSVTRSDVAVRILVLLRTATDSTTYADSAARVLAAVRSVADSVTRSDVATRLGVFLRTVSDFVTRSDAALRVIGGLVSGIRGPVGIAINAIGRAFGIDSRPGGSGSGPRPGGSAIDPKTTGSATDPKPGSGTGST